MWRRALVILHDACWIPLAIALAFWLRFNLGTIPPEMVSPLITMMVIALPVHLVTFWFFGCYRGIWHFASVPDLIRLSKAVFIGALISLAIHFAWDRLASVPRTAAVLYPFILLGATAGARLMVRVIKDHSPFAPSGDDVRRALIIGAGHSGELLYRGMQRDAGLEPVAFVDDDPAKRGTEVHGLRVRGPISQLDRLIRKCRADLVIVAIPTMPRKTLSEIIATASEAGVDCQVVPAVTDYHSAGEAIGKLRPVTTEDLLGRDQVSLDEAAIAAVVRERTVLVTGGGGSIGLELCRRVLQHGAGRLLVFDCNEYNLYKAQQELHTGVDPDRVQFLLGDVCDERRVRNLFDEYRPEVVFHAAAYKQVPLLESNAVEALRNNVVGTHVVAEVAGEQNVKKFVLVSTDKTVNPTNIMGATKRIAERLCLGMQRRWPDTAYVIVRFGNVLGSAGSVIPLFERQIREGGPVTVTHPEVKRFFMTTEEAVGLILQATSQSRGGDVYVLDMGEPVPIRELAENMIRLSGLTPGKDIDITYTGLRPGEKLEEELFYREEELRGTRHPKLLLARECERDSLARETLMSECGNALAAGSERQAIECIKSLVPAFCPMDDDIPEKKAHIRLIK